MGTILHNAVLLHLDPLRVGRGCLRIEDELIVDVTGDIAPSASDEIVDCEGCVVMPGLVNGHTHLYSSLAVGMPPPPRAPKDFHEILQLVWWRLDQALDEESIEVSGMIGALEALRCGTTTLIDHHASPEHIEGSLDALERGIAATGLRAVLCYETTDRNGMGGAEAGLAENRRYAEKCAKRRDDRFAAMIGAHAAFTMSDETLTACAQLGKEYGVGVHIHVAEDPCDDRLCREEYGAPLTDRLERLGVVQPESILAHCTHLSPGDAGRLSQRVRAVAHNPRSNMNNGVGYAPVESLDNMQLGTDGIGSDMTAEARFAWFKARDAHAKLTLAGVVDMLAQAARTASRRLGRTLGKLEAGAAADVVVTDYRPATPMDEANAAGHVIFGVGSRHVRHVMVDGRWALRDRVVQALDEDTVRRRARETAHRLWHRMRAI